MPSAGGFYSAAFIPEIPFISNATWVVAKFTHYHLIPISSDYQSFYTEENFKILQIIQQPLQGALTVGGQFQIDLIGGVIRAPQGNIVRKYLNPLRYAEQPGHTYLLQLIPEQGSLFTINKRWDVSNGKVVPDRDEEVARTLDGEAKLSGLSVSAAVGYLKSDLSKESTK